MLYFLCFGSISVLQTVDSATVTIKISPSVQNVGKNKFSVQCNFTTKPPEFIEGIDLKIDGKPVVWLNLARHVNYVYYPKSSMPFVNELKSRSTIINSKMNSKLSNGSFSIVLPDTQLKDRDKEFTCRLKYYPNHPNVDTVKTIEDKGSLKVLNTGKSTSVLFK